MLFVISDLRTLRKLGFDPTAARISGIDVSPAGIA
jgi:hypothetical protein